MRKLFLLCGAPASGKSTFIKSHGLGDFTISSDALRLLYRAPVYDVQGNWSISQSDNKMVWNLLYSMVEERMKSGSVTFVDATHTGKTAFSKYYALAKKYRYEIYVIQFHTPLEVCIKQNRGRKDTYRIVPDTVIREHYERLQRKVFPAFIHVIDADAWSLFESGQDMRSENSEPLLVDLNEYQDVKVIGDIHGCYDAVRCAGFVAPDPNIAYIFTGDFLDRGPQNAEVLRWVLSIHNNQNVFMLEGNHERHLWDWVNDREAVYSEFENRTKKQLDAASGIRKSQCAFLCKRLLPYLIVHYHGNIFYISHGGVSTRGAFSVYVPNELFIRGCGGYADLESVVESWNASRQENEYMIHGHRNLKRHPIRESEGTFNLEGQVESGGELRVLSLNTIQ